MRFITADIYEFNDAINNKKIVCFCASQKLRTYAAKNGYQSWIDRISFFVDNNYEKNNYYKLEGFDKSWEVKSPNVLKDCDGDYVLLILSGVFSVIKDIVLQLNDMNLPDSIECYSLLQMEENGVKAYDNSELEKYVFSGGNRINKTIHCCWFSGEDKPQKYIDCINSWKKNCPDYEIIEWNSENYDFKKNDYMYEAYKKRKWAFVSDYARLDLVYNYGGIYLDMDVEVVKPLDDLLKYECFLGEDNYGLIDFGSGFGAAKGNKLIGRLLEAYDGFEFKCSGEKIDFSETVPQPTLLLPILKEYGYKAETRTQIIEDCVCLSPDYFRVMDDPEHLGRDISGTEYALHWHHGGWVDREHLEAKSNHIKEKKAFLEFWKKMGNYNET